MSSPNPHSQFGKSSNHLEQMNETREHNNLWSSKKDLNTTSLRISGELQDNVLYILLHVIRIYSLLIFGLQAAFNLTIFNRIYLDTTMRVIPKTALDWKPFRKEQSLKFPTSISKYSGPVSSLMTSLLSTLIVLSPLSLNIWPKEKKACVL